MARYALVNPQGAVDRLSASVDPSVETKTGWKWLACDPGAQPIFDPLAEIVEGPTYTVGVNAVTESWTKRNLTAQEISDRKDSAVTSINGGFSPIEKVLFNHENRVRVLEGKATVTLAQFRAGVKALL